MTTIAFDGKRLACDRQTSLGDTAWTTCTKLKKLDDGRYFVGCGTTSAIKQMFDWFNSGAEKKSKPKVTDFSALIVASEGVISYVDEDGCLCEASAPIAMGTGWKFAAAAMRLNQSADQAIALAAEFDGGTGGGVDYVDVIIDEKSKNKKSR